MFAVFRGGDGVATLQHTHPHRFLQAFVPIFSEPDNPGAYSASMLTRCLTLNFYHAFNARQLLWPAGLCCDWARGGLAWSCFRNRVFRD